MSDWLESIDKNWIASYRKTLAEVTSARRRRTCGTDGLHHGFLRANALKHGISPNSLRQIFDLRYAFVTTFGHDVGRTKLSCEFLSRIVAAHGDNSLSTHLLG